MIYERDNYNEILSNHDDVQLLNSKIDAVQPSFSINASPWTDPVDPTTKTINELGKRVVVASSTK